MMELNFTLLSDGSSDRALLPILTWLLKEQRVMFGINPEWADLRRLPKPPKTLAERIVRAVDLYPCDLLFIHRRFLTSTHSTSIQGARTRLGRSGRVSVRELDGQIIYVARMRSFLAWVTGIDLTNSRS